MFSMQLMVCRYELIKCTGTQKTSHRMSLFRSTKFAALKHTVRKSLGRCATHYTMCIWDSLTGEGSSSRV